MEGKTRANGMIDQWAETGRCCAGTQKTEESPEPSYAAASEAKYCKDMDFL